MQIKETLLQDDNIIKVLEFYNYFNIKKEGKEIRCGLKEKSNPRAIVIYLDERLGAIDFSRSIKGDIFTLISKHKNIRFSNIISDIKKLLDIKVDFLKKYNNESVSRVFEGIVFKEKIEINVYDEEILEQYSNYWNTKFLKDGISIETQRKFDIGYDEETNRITIPHRTPEGELCGIIGRLNRNGEEYKKYKYLPLIPFKKSNILYGYSNNYNELYCAENIYIGEAEKFVMQLDSMGYNNALALSGSMISTEQCKEIAKLTPKSVTICFDEGVDEEVILRNANKLAMFTERMNIKIKIMIDRENLYLKEGSKDSPTDNGLEVWEKLKDNCCEIIN
ncbi:hypothetical protein [Peptostreptococcus faecalis]|uniref:hypothetical protein n=1 Tax=Peptostreptococcus faecalis TaxID=2045015 RepID=UPI000C7D2379|nr:hypothetical protein [Peptostreptococcus faecalis]